MIFVKLSRHSLFCIESMCTVMPMCVFVAHVLYLQCILGPRARTGRHVD